MHANKRITCRICRQEFLEREQAMLAAGTKFIFPLPKIEIVGA